MRKSALHYLGQHSTSIANLRQVLLRRSRRRLGPDADVAAMIERTIEYCRSLGFVDDAAFVEARLHAGRGRGHSARRIGAALAAKGVDRALVAQAFAQEALAAEAGETSEERAAARLAQRRRIGPWRRSGKGVEIEKEIAMLARGGFGLALARRIVTGDPDDIQGLLDA